MRVNSLNFSKNKHLNFIYFVVTKKINFVKKSLIIIPKILVLLNSFKKIYTRCLSLLPKFGEKKIDHLGLR